MEHRKTLLVASFLTLIAAGVGFAVRSDVLAEWGVLFRFTKTELGTVTGMGFAGFGMVIIIASFFADRVGYRALLVAALVVHLVSFVGTMAATPVYDHFGKEATYQLLKWSMFLFAVGNGLCEAAINPLVATLYPDKKTHYLNILHAGWPGGMILGGLLAWMFVGDDAVVHALRWEIPMAFFLVPVVMYGSMILREEFPESEAQAANVQRGEMLRVLVAPMFLLLLLLHAMIGYVELGTDSWIANILNNALPGRSILIFVYTAGLMFVLRFFAGPIVERINPLGLLLFSSILACIGLYALGSVQVGAMIFVAATIYGLGKTFLWPTMLGVVGERFPHGGAIAMGMIGGVGMLSAGLLGGPGIGYTQDLQASQYLQSRAPEAYARVKSEDPRSFLLFAEVWGLDEAKVERVPPGDPQRQVILAAAEEGGRKAMRVTALIPGAMAVLYLLLVGIFYARGGYRTVRLKREF
jgi:MFS family permease